MALIAMALLTGYLPYACDMHMTPSETVRALHRALESGTQGDALRAHFTDDATTIERPNQLKPAGATATLEQMIEASANGAQMLSWQRYEELSMLEHGSTVAVRCTWTGEIARDVGPFKAGQVLTAHIAQFIEVQGSKVASIETYDCYEPF